MNGCSITIFGHYEDDAGAAWMAGISQQWADELNDPREDIYTLADGEAARPIG